MPIVDNEVVPDYDYSFDDLPKISAGKWLYNTIVENLEKYGDGPYMSDVSTGRSVTFSELLNNVRKIASALWRRGLRPGDTVVLMASNHVETAQALIAILQCGAAINPLTLNLPARDIRSRCDHTFPKFAFTDQVRAPRVMEAFKEVDYVKEIFVIGGRDGCTSFETLLQDDGTEFPENPEVDLDSTPAIMYSSGTTGNAKAILIDHFTWRKNHILKPIVNGLFGNRDGQKSLLNKKVLFINPIINAGGLQNTFMGIIGKTHLLVMSDFSDNKFVEAIDSAKPDVISAFPTQLVWMCKNPDLHKYDLSSVKVFICGGGCINPHYEREIWNKMPSLMFLLTGYGMTEVGVITSNASLFGVPTGSRNAGHVFGSVGKLYPNCRLKVLDENGQKLGPRQQGHVIFKSPTFMRGYLDNPEAVKEIFRDGWCYSGDRGYYDEDGNIYITGRFKELIKYRMAHVVPANIEKYLLTHPAVAEAVVIGIPDDEAEELPLACVVKRPGFSVTEQELVDMIAGLVADEERLRGGVLFVDQIPRNDWGKPMRRFLLEAALKR